MDDENKENVGTAEVNSSAKRPKQGDITISKEEWEKVLAQANGNPILKYFDMYILKANAYTTQIFFNSE